jgi:hypothetical protein
MSIVLRDMPYYRFRAGSYRALQNGGVSLSTTRI